MDGLVALTIVILAGERAPADTPELGERLEAVLEQRRALCRHVEAAVGTALSREGGRTRAADLLADGSSDGASSMIGAAVQIWHAYRHADQVNRDAILSRIEATRWLAYTEIAAGSGW
jgi:hypothetical protein